MFRGVGEAITVQRPDGSIAYANDAAPRALGFSSPEELLATSPLAIVDRFEILNEGEPFPLDRFPGRIVLQGADEAEDVVRYRRRDTGEEHWSIVKATAIRDAEGELLYAVNLFRDVTALRRCEEWQRFLADAGEILNASLDSEPTARELAHLVVPQLADWCSVHVGDETGSARQIALAHADPERVSWARELQERYPPDPEAKTGVPGVIRTGRAELHEEIPEDLLEAAAVDQTHLDLIRRLQLRSAMIVPLSARGRTFGALTFVAAESGRRYGPDDLAQAEDVARRAALAIDNALLHHTAQEARRDAELAASVSSRLHATTASLARAATPGEVGPVAVDEGAAALDADAGAVFLASDHGERFMTLAHAGYPPELEAEHSSFVADADSPVTEAARTRHPVVVASGEELVLRWPGLASDQGATGDQATSPSRSSSATI